MGRAAQRRRRAGVRLARGGAACGRRSRGRCGGGMSGCCCRPERSTMPVWYCDRMVTERIGDWEPRTGRHNDSPAEVFGFSGGAALLQMAAVDAAGGFPAPYFLYYEDTTPPGGCGWPAAASRTRRARWSGSDWPARTRRLRCSLPQQRNRLLTLTRCAPAGVALRQLARFRWPPARWRRSGCCAGRCRRRRHFRVGLRLRVLGSYARLLPWALRTRRAIGRRATVGRAAVARSWPGR